MFMFSPEMSNLDAIFDEGPADAEMTRNLFRRSARQHKAAQRLIRNQRGSTDGVGRFFVIVIVVAGAGSASPCLGVRVTANNRQPIRLVPEKDVRDFFHQGGAVSLLAM